jgi:hypothetical protein
MIHLYGDLILSGVMARNFSKICQRIWLFLRVTSSPFFVIPELNIEKDNFAEVLLEGRVHPRTARKGRLDSYWVIRTKFDAAMDAFRGNVINFPRRS